jgi:hypothetical protein
MAERAFNALNGKEIQGLILREVQEKLALDDRFDRDVEVAAGSMTFTLQVDEAVQPIVFTVQVTQTYKAPAGKGLPIRQIRENILRDIQNNFDRDERFAQHLTYPKVTWKHRILLDLNILNGDGRLRELAVGESPLSSHQIDLTRKPLLVGGTTGGEAPRLVDITLQPRSEFIVDENGRKFRMVPVEEPPMETGGTSPVVVPTHHRQFENVTGTGLPIEAAFKPSPGAAFAESRGGSIIVAIAGTTRETIELGTQHPDLEDGGVGAPDSVRRENGLVVPGQQSGRTHSGIVDLPAGSF